jgi:UDP-N-acetylmuramate dehydrogenase
MSFLDGLEHFVQLDTPLAPFNSLRLGGPASFFAVPTSQAELVAVVNRAREHGLPTKLLGDGANVLVPTAGFSGLVIQLAAPEFTQISVAGNRLHAGGGVKLAHFVSLAAREGFKGPEQLVGIPGTVGGALHVNTSTVGGNIGAWVQRATVLTAKGEVWVRSRDQMNFSYRQSSLNELAILAAEFEFEQESSESVARRMQKLWIVRKSKQPLLEEPCSYVFKDQGGSTASQVLTKAGIQGLKVGGIEVSDRDPNFFVARPGSTSEQFLELVQRAKQQVWDRLGIELELSVDVW